MPSNFTELIARLRSGDARAAEELFREYEPAVRVAVRRRMHDPRLQRVFDSMDVCQSVFGSFFVRASLGQFDLNDPAEVIKLLVGMAHNKLALQVRKAHSQCRDNRRVQTLGPRQLETPASDPSPSETVAGQELFQAALRELTLEERQLAERRAKGQTWDDVAAEMGGTAQGRQATGTGHRHDCPALRAGRESERLTRSPTIDMSLYRGKPPPRQIFSGYSVPSGERPQVN